MQFDLERKLPDGVLSEANISYREHINEDAVNDRLWLESNTSYIWKIGVLLAIDSNKADWIYAVIGYQRRPDSKPEHLGTMYFPEGENDDVEQTMVRALQLMRIAAPWHFDKSDLAPKGMPNLDSLIETLQCVQGRIGNVAVHCKDLCYGLRAQAKRKEELDALAASVSIGANI